MEDTFLIIRLNCSSKQAFAELYRKYVGKIYNYVHALTGDEILSEDLTQFCFMKVWEKRSEIKAKDNFPAYLYTIARNAVYKEIRRNTTSQAYIEYLLHSTDIGADTNIEQVNFNLLREEIDKVISDLPESRKLIYALSTEEHLSNEDIADKLNISVKTVETQIRRATLAIWDHIKKLH